MTVSLGRKEPNWTAEADATLLALSKAGLSMPIIAERLGRTPDACASRKVRITSKPEAIGPMPDCLGDRINAYLARIAKLNSYEPDDLKLRCYGWR